jgi:peptidoglycan/xylan/chitin deacetylase (PgdA/CDA1 family)
VKKYALLVGLLGVAFYLGYQAVEAPANQIFGRTLVNGPLDRREVALTYDDGPNPPYTDRILDVLRAERVHATFFVVGRAVVADPAVVRRIVREGHAIGNHTWDHRHLLVETPATMRSELTRTDNAIFAAAGVRTRLLRPPFGARDFAVLGEARQLGYTVVMWSVPLPNDWEQPGGATIAERVLDKVGDGSIIVLHDGNRGIVCRATHASPALCDRSQDVAATRLIVERLRARGFRFVTVPQLMADAAREKVLALKRSDVRAAR